ncbi:MAG: hypothetical protein IIY87_06165 [Bacteroidales bacterium]|nr:hypothetical protein [Bacteroidales bacterium]
MKKVVLALAAVAVVACFSLTSCNKKCTCKTYAAGVVVQTTEDVELDRDTYKKCSDLNTIVVSDPKTGMECN